jgi:hypothetical protein
VPAPPPEALGPEPARPPPLGLPPAAGLSFGDPLLQESSNAETSKAPGNERLI